MAEAIPLHSKEVKENTEELVNLIAGRQTKTFKLKNKNYYYNIGFSIQKFLEDDFNEQTSELKESVIIQKKNSRCFETSLCKTREKNKT